MQIINQHFERIQIKKMNCKKQIQITAEKLLLQINYFTKTGIAILYCLNFLLDAKSGYHYMGTIPKTP